MAIIFEVIATVFLCLVVNTTQGPGKVLLWELTELKRSVSIYCSCVGGKYVQELVLCCLLLSFPSAPDAEKTEVMQYQKLLFVLLINSLFNL